MNSDTIGTYCLLGLSLALTGFSYGSGVAPDAEQDKWRAVLPAIETALHAKGTACQPGTTRFSVVDAADFLGTSVALIDLCPLGAYTQLIDAMRLDGNQPVLARFRKGGHEIAPGFARGASVMHGKDVKLVPEEHSIYDISWDNEATEGPGMVGLKKCAVDAYVWNPKTLTFDYDPKLTMQATRSYCIELKHQVH
jgi:hypothetical protein